MEIPMLRIFAVAVLGLGLLLLDGVTGVTSAQTVNGKRSFVPGSHGPQATLVHERYSYHHHYYYAPPRRWHHERSSWRQRWPEYRPYGYGYRHGWR
jgi:hypothetical protein